MITITLRNELAKKLSELLKDQCNKDDDNDYSYYDYDFEVIARYIDLALQGE